MSDDTLDVSLMTVIVPKRQPLKETFVSIQKHTINEEVEPARVHAQTPIFICAIIVRALVRLDRMLTLETDSNGVHGTHLFSMH